MSTQFNKRAELLKIIDRLDDSDLKQIICFAAGYEVGKAGATPDISTYIQMAVRSEAEHKPL